MKWLLALALGFVLYFIFGKKGKKATKKGVEYPKYDWEAEKSPRDYRRDDFVEDFEFDVAGVHIPERKANIIQFAAIGKDIAFYRSPTNPVNPKAIKVFIEENNAFIGYVPDYLLYAFNDEEMPFGYEARIKDFSASLNWVDVTIGVMIAKQ